MPKAHKITLTHGLRGAGEVAAPPVACPLLHLLSSSSRPQNSSLVPCTGAASSPGPTPPAEFCHPQARPWPRCLQHRDGARQECA